jgi:RNase P/RNase MRP subunit p29
LKLPAPEFTVTGDDRGGTRSHHCQQEDTMKRMMTLVVGTLVAMNAIAADTYQVTGPVVSVTDKTIVVQKDNEKWEIAKDQATAVKGGEIKVGSKVTIKYKMTATSIEVKDK